ncbi:AAA family ATPase [Flindersiella endophytica]
MVMTAPAVRRASRELRGRELTELHYPANSLVLLAGVPGAGKSTLLRRMSWESGGRKVRVLDSTDVRAWLQPVLGRLPYARWRPVVHTLHYLRVVGAIALGGPLVVHDCLTRPWVRWAFGTLARGTGLRVHLLLLDATEQEALDGQRARGRQVREDSFRLHCRRWRKVLRMAEQDPARLVQGAESAVVLDRRAAARVTTIRFR